jgi:probable HAF family extracellular repeat protein
MKSRIKSVVDASLAAAVVVGLTGLARGASAVYSIALIPTLDPSGKGSIFAQGISSNGLVTGYYETSVSGGFEPQTFVAQVAGTSVATQNTGYYLGDLPSTSGNFFYDDRSWGFSVNSTGTGTGVVAGDNLYWAVSTYNGVPVTGLGSGGLEAPYVDGTARQGSGDLNFGAAINNNGVIVGASYQGAGTASTSQTPTVHAFVYSNGAYTDLSSGAASLFTSAAYGVNAAGNAAVGFQTTSTYNAYANSQSSLAATTKTATEWTLNNGVWSNANLSNTVLTGGAQSVAYAINSVGQMVGCSETNLGSGIQGDAFLRQPGANGAIIDLTAAVDGATGSGALGNPIFGGSSGFLGLKNNPLNSGLGNVTSCADAINDEGQVVGFYKQSGVNQAFVATVSSSNVVTITNLNTLIPAQPSNGWFLQEATGINDAGQIVGYGTYAGKTTSFELNLAPVGQWAQSSGGSWATAGNWQGGVPNAAGAMATFASGPGLTSSGTVTLDGNKTVGNLTFNSASSYTINPGTGGTLTFDDTLDLAGASATITVANGAHSINVPIVLATNGGSSGLTVNTLSPLNGTPATLELGGSVSALNNGSATLTAAGAGSLIIAPSAVINVPLIANGGGVVTSDDGTQAGQPTIVFAANTNPNAGITVHVIPSLNISQGYSSVVLAPATSTGSRQLLVTSLNLASSANDAYQTGGGFTGQWAGLLDIANNDLDIRNGNLANITNMVAQNYNGGTWTAGSLDGGYYQGAIIEKGGIESSIAAADTTYLTAIGVIQNQTLTGSRLYATFDTQPVASTDVLVKYTYYGDANLDGVVDGSDYSLVDYAYQYNKTHPDAPLTGWYNGDFNYDGVTDGSDYTLMDNAFNTQGASLAAELAATTAQISNPDASMDAALGATAVPEPASLGAAAAAFSALLLGRRRQKR